MLTYFNTALENELSDEKDSKNRPIWQLLSFSSVIYEFKNIQLQEISESNR